MLHEKQDPDSTGSVWINPLFADRAFTDVPKHALGDQPMPAAAAAQIVADELMIDGNARLNLATFVTTWMEPEARILMAKTFEKNAIDKDEYPQTAAIEARCVSILARPVGLGRLRQGGRHLDARLERGGDAGRPRAQVALEGAPRGSRKPDHRAEPRYGRKRPGVLGEVLPLLRRRAAAGAGGGRGIT